MFTLHLIRELNVRLHYVYSAFDPIVKCKAELSAERQCLFTQRLIGELSVRWLCFDYT